MADLVAEGDNAWFAALSPAASTHDAGQAERDDFAPCGIEDEADIRDLFVPSFAFGCEADDRMNATAFNTRVNPFGARLNAPSAPTSATSTSSTWTGCSPTPGS